MRDHLRTITNLFCCCSPVTVSVRSEACLLPLLDEWHRGSDFRQEHGCMWQLQTFLGITLFPRNTKQCYHLRYTVIPRLTKIIRSGITFVRRNLRQPKRHVIRRLTSRCLESKQPSRVGGSPLCDVVSSFLCLQLRGCITKRSTDSTKQGTSAQQYNVIIT